MNSISIKKRENKVLTLKNIKMITLGLLVTSAALADGVWVKGSTSQRNEYGAGQTIILANIEVTYQKQNLPWGSEVFLVSGYRCQNGGSWQNRTYPEPMAAVADFTWQKKLNATVGNRYTGFCGNYEFVFLIKLPNGQSYYDNGGRGSIGFYSARIPYNSLGSVTHLPIRTLSTPFEY